MSNLFTSIKHKNTSVTLLTSRANSFLDTEIERADQVRKIHRCMMWPSKTTMTKIFKNKDMNNSDLTVSGLERAIQIYGEAPEILSGKMTVPSKRKDSNTQIMLHKLGKL